MMKKGIIYVIAFFKVLYNYIGKKITWERQRQIAKAMSIFLVAVMVLVSIGFSGGDAPVDVEMAANTAMSSGHNQISSGKDSARIEMKQSKVSKKNSETAGKNGNNVVKKNSAAAVDGKVPNAVVKNPAPLSLIEKVYENHGRTPEFEGGLYRYQYPVEIGYAVDSNYDGRQAAGDYVFSNLYNTQDIDKNIEKELEKEKEREKLASGDAEEKEVDAEEADVTEDEKETDEDTTFASGDAAEVENSVQTDNTVDKKELSFLKDVWSLIMPTKPSEVNIKNKPKTETPKVVDLDAGKEVKKQVFETVATDTTEADKNDEKKPETSSEENVSDTVDESDSTDNSEEASELDDSDKDREEVLAGQISEDSNKENDTESKNDSRDEASSITADSSYFVVSGRMRTDAEVFVSDIVIKPTGIDGFDKIRIGTDGEFGDSAIITKDGDKETIKLYFSDGSRVTDAVDYIYSKDTVAPSFAFSEENITKLQSDDFIIYCTNKAELEMEATDDVEECPGTGIARYNYLYGDTFKYIFDNFEEAKLVLPDAFFGRVLVNCADKAGNTSGIVSRHYLVESNAPTVQIFDEEMCSAPYTMWVDVAESGAILSGIQDITCTINGEPCDLQDMQILENTVLGVNLEVPTKMTFPIVLQEEGSYTIEVKTRDYAGNETVETKVIEVKKPELVSVLMPKEFTIHIDPQQLAGREQIFSDDITLKNVSEFDVDVVVTGVNIYVSSGVSDEGIKKDCKIYLIAPDTGERIALKNGENSDSYSFRLPAGEENAALYFVGDIAKGSETLWRDADLSIGVQLSFTKSE